MNVQSITLDLSKRQIPTQIVRIGQGDNDGTTIQAKILDNGTVTSLSGFSASFEMRLPDGESYVRDVNCTVNGSTVTYVVDEEHCCAVDGYTDEAYFSLIKNGVTYSTSRFRVKIERSAHDGATPAESWDTEIDQLIERGEQAVADAEQAVSDAQTAVTNANRAVTNANTAVSNANTAVSNANAATASANSAAASANSAAESATSAAARATSASNLATSSAQQAIDARDAANGAATSANSAATNANDKASDLEDRVDEAIRRMEQVVDGKIELYAMTEEEVTRAVEAAF